MPLKISSYYQISMSI
uniref:Uncharacterized protein n=1 Tax=Arundo donax TaxID=35708 RepID=A0A0A9GNW2_ARUDO